MKDINWIVVGGAGEIGLRLISRKKMDYVVVDRKPVINFEQGFLCDLLKLSDLDNLFYQLSKRKWNVLYLAGLVRPGTSESDVKDLFEANVIALGQFLLKFKFVVNHFVYASSISVYGKGGDSPLSVSEAGSPVSVYGSSKWAAECLVRTVFQDKDNWTILRIAQLFDINTAESTLPHVLLRKALKKEELELTANPLDRRDYLHADDLVSFLEKFMLSPKAGIYNVGCGFGYELGQVFDSVATQFGVNYSVKTVSNSSFSQVLDITQTLEDFSWVPGINLEDWYRAKKMDFVAQT